jgi:hypothetical protein
MNEPIHIPLVSDVDASHYEGAFDLENDSIVAIVRNEMQRLVAYRESIIASGRACCLHARMFCAERELVPPLTRLQDLVSAIDRNIETFRNGLKDGSINDIDESKELRKLLIDYRANLIVMTRREIAEDGYRKQIATAWRLCDFDTVRRLSRAAVDREFHMHETRQCCCED